jgi:hypothetical protein
MGGVMRLLGREILQDGSTVEYFDDEGVLGVNRSQDVEAILDANKAMVNQNDGYSDSRNTRRVASVPNVVIEKWLIEEGLDIFSQDPAMKRRVRAKLNSSEYAYLRTAPGRI